MRIACVGSRSITDKDIVRGILLPLISTNELVAVLSGGAKGVDKLAQEVANEEKVPFFLYKPYHLVDNSTEYNPRYFFTRNKQIVDNCDLLIALWDGESKGTAHAIKYAKKANKHYRVYDLSGSLKEEG